MKQNAFIHETMPGGTPSSNAATPFPYPIAYSSDFEIGKPEHAQVVLDLWKDFDVNTLDKGTPVFAEEVLMDFCDGTFFQGSRNDFMEAMKSQRATFITFVSSIDSVISLQPKGKEESWVCVWGRQDSTGKDNKAATIYINENWMFDKDGKVSYIRQLNSSLPRQQPERDS